MKWNKRDGFTLVELLLALSCALFCSVLLTLLAAYANRASQLFAYHTQDQMAVLQLRLYLAEADEWQLQDNTVQVLHYGEECMFLFDRQRLIKQSGYEIFLQDIDAGAFEQQGGKLYVSWRRDQQKKKALLAS